MFFEVYDTDSLAGEVELFNIYFALHDCRLFEKCIHHKKHGEERHHPKTENLLDQNQSHRVYHK